MTSVDAKQLVQALVTASKFKDTFDKNVRFDFPSPCKGTLTYRGDVVASVVTLSVDGESGYGFCVDREDMLTLCRRAGDKLEFSVDGGRLVAKKGKATFSLPIAYGGEVGALEVPTLSPSDAVLSFSGKQFQDVLSPLLASMGDDENKPHMAGVLFDATSAVTTDGHRFVVLALPEELRPLAPVFLPRPAVEFLEQQGKAFPNCEARVYLIEGRVHVEIGDVYALCPGVEGKFPPYRMLMPTLTEWSATFDCADFVAACADLLSLKSTKALPIQWQATEGKVDVRAEGPGGATEATFDALVVGAPTPISFGGQHLQEAAKSLKSSKKTTVAFGGSFKPALFSGQADNGWGLEILLMPRR